MKVNKYILPSFTLLALLATILIAQWTGQWITSGKQLVDVNNLTTTDDIRGWMTLQQVADGFSLEVIDLYALLQLPADLPPETALKDLEGIIPNFEVTTVREALASYADGATIEKPNEGQATTGSPPAATVTVAQPTATPTPLAANDTGNKTTGATSDTVVAAPAENVHTAQGDGSGIGPTPLPPGATLVGTDIKGKQTLQEVAEQTQVPLDALLAALDLPVNTDPTLAIRDLVEQGQITEIEVVRAAVTTLQGE